MATPTVRSLVLIILSLAGITQSSDAFPQTAPALFARGQLLANPPPLLGTYTGSALVSGVTNGAIAQWLLRKTFSPRCSVSVYQFQYGTVGGQGEQTTASGALMVPTGPDPTCQGPRPIVLYAHGKRNLRWFNMADLSGSNYEATVLALALGADGYIVIAPNYAGYDTSPLGYHPFLNADQQAADMMDALTAARSAFPNVNATDNQKLFVTGYSEGGYVAMATHRALQAAGIPVTASAPMSGPYALVAFSDVMFMGQVGLGAVDEFATLASSYQHSYGNLYTTPTELFEAKYSQADTLFPATTGVDNLVAAGLLPESAVFSSTPPTPDLASITPATTPSILAGMFANGFGTDNLVTNTYRLSYIQDVLANPDGGSVPPSATPANPLRADLKVNDLRNWAPVAPMLLCGGNGDLVVYYFNTQLMQYYLTLNAPTSPVTVLDVDSEAPPGSPYRNLTEEFSATKKLVKWIEGQSFVTDNYHDVLVPAFCIQAAKSFFEGF
jgi:alpha/beta superfamily hydrolase